MKRLQIVMARTGGKFLPDSAAWAAKLLRKLGTKYHVERRTRHPVFSAHRHVSNHATAIFCKNPRFLSNSAHSHSPQKNHHPSRIVISSHHVEAASRTPAIGTCHSPLQSFPRLAAPTASLVPAPSPHALECVQAAQPVDSCLQPTARARSPFHPPAFVRIVPQRSPRNRWPQRRARMKYAGLLVMPAGFFLSLAAILLFPSPLPRATFVLCGLAVQALGLAVAFRGHMLSRAQRRP